MSVDINVSEEIGPVSSEKSLRTHLCPQTQTQTDFFSPIVKCQSKMTGDTKTGKAAI